jgi:hypothetical protein
MSTDITKPSTETTGAEDRRERNQQVARTILEQLGGQRRLIAFVGARNFVAHDEAVSFKFVAGGPYNYVKIELTPQDLYKVTFMKLHNFKTVREATLDGVYNDMLVDIFVKYTKLYLSL